MVKHLPFYMVYETEEAVGKNAMHASGTRGDMYTPGWNEEYFLHRDYDYMKSAYPDMAKRILPFVEEECDRMEYSGSMMFDEYPDQLQVRMMCRRIEEKLMEKVMVNELEGTMRQDRSKGRNNWLRDLIWVITWQEILKRRSEYRKYRRKFY